MSSSTSRGGASGERMVHQDFIARIRYSNTLPPPPNPPKLLDIPNTGLGSGHYTTPGFASRLAREQPLNVEADAELGMPLDLIGMPGVFDGDESSIQALSHPPPVHPHDRALLKPLSTLGKPRTTEANVSFLRRTEYISSQGGKSSAVSGLLRPKASAGSRRPEKRPSPEPDAGTPAYVKRKIEQSFVAAQTAARDRYARVRHPTKKGLKLTAAYPLLPDLGAFPDSGAYVTIKFSNNPVLAGTGVYDTRLLSGIFKPIDQSDEERAAYEAALKAHERDPLRNPRPQNRMQYEFFLPDQAATGDAFRHVFDDSTHPDDPDERFNFARVRAYESVEEKELSHTTKYSEEILLALADDAAAAAPDLGARVAGGPRAALYYPVMQRTVVRSARVKNLLARTASSAAVGIIDPGLVDGADGLDGADRAVDRLQVAVREPTDEMREHLALVRSDPLHFHEAEAEAEEAATAAEAQAAAATARQKASQGDDHDSRSRSSSPTVGRHTNGHDDDSEDQDADGDDDEA